jgi:cation:H+ antiporter
MVLTVLTFVVGLIALVAGAESLVRGASRLALAIGISPLVVGLTVVAFGTSSPETAIAIGAVVNGTTDIAIGNVVGSNICNVLFVLGISAIVAPLVVDSQVIRQEVPIMIGGSVLLLAFVLDGRLSVLDSSLLLIMLVLYIIYLIRQSRAETKAVRDEYEVAVGKGGGHWALQVGMIVGGLALLVFGADWMVDSAVKIARVLGVSDLVIGLTVVAAGTSMPEVATSLLAALRGERDIAVGNVIGSNTFNLLGCLGLSGIVSGEGLTIAPAVMHFDLWVMIAVAVACLPVFVAGRSIGRGKGLIFVGYYFAYVAYLILGAQDHDALEGYSRIMLGFVVPLTIVTLVAMVVHDQQRRNGGGPGA